VIIIITRFVGTPPRKETLEPLNAAGVKVLRLRSGHTKLVLYKPGTSREFIDMPPGTEVDIEGGYA
jgi:hypothetical protein